MKHLLASNNNFLLKLATAVNPTVIQTVIKSYDINKGVWGQPPTNNK